MKVHLNDIGVVTLNEHGVQAMRDHYEALGRTDLLAIRYPDLGPGMVLRTHLWDLFRVFGHAISLGSPSPFDAGIEITPS